MRAELELSRHVAALLDLAEDLQRDLKRAGYRYGLTETLYQLRLELQWARRQEAWEMAVRADEEREAGEAITQPTD